MRVAESETVNPITRGGMGTEHCAAIIVLAALALLILIRRGFRGISVGGASVNLG